MRRASLAVAPAIEPEDLVLPRRPGSLPDQLPRAGWWLVIEARTTRVAMQGDLAIRLLLWPHEPHSGQREQCAVRRQQSMRKDAGRTAALPNLLGDLRREPCVRAAVVDERQIQQVDENPEHRQASGREHRTAPEHRRPRANAPYDEDEPCCARDHSSNGRNDRDWLGKTRHEPRHRCGHLGRLPVTIAM